jgi:Kef-type K+ transport system membrane component KefB
LLNLLASVAPPAAEPLLLWPLSLLLIGGFSGGLLIKYLRMPMVTGYMLMGCAMGPFVLNWVHEDITQQLMFIETYILGLISFAIGEELQIKRLMRIGRSVLSITLADVFLTFALVFGGCLAIGKPLHYALLLGAIVTSTAPAATMMVVREYKASGPLVERLMVVIVLDNILGITLFGLAVALAHGLTDAADSSLFHLAIPLVKNLLGSTVLGIFSGSLLKQWIDKTEHQDYIAIGVLGLIGMTCALAEMLNVSLLLANMVSGILVANFASHAPKAFQALKRVDAPLYVIFFALAGALLHLDKVLGVGLVGVVYVICRSLGKYVGAWLGAFAAGTEARVRNLIGLALLPQAGVAIGFAIVVNREFPDIGPELLTVVFAAIIIFEIIGPMAATIAMKRSGEAYKALDNSK